jgi:hypothetical protein
MTAVIAPNVEVRPSRPYVAKRFVLARESIGGVVGGVLGELGLWASDRAVSLGAPLVRYLVVDYGSGDVTVDVGFLLLSRASDLRDGFLVGELPAGQWACVMHRGGYAELVDTTASLLEWGRGSGVTWSGDTTGEFTRWGGRVETYLVGVESGSDPGSWLTEVAILIDGEPQARVSA